SDQMLPEAALPDTPLTARPADFAQPLRLRDRRREYDFDQSPPRGKVRVAFRQSPDRMKVVGQHDECVDVEWVPLARAARGLTQGLDVVGQKTAAPIEEISGKNPPPAGDKDSPIIGHAAG